MTLPINNYRTCRITAAKSWHCVHIIFLEKGSLTCMPIVHTMRGYNFKMPLDSMKTNEKSQRGPVISTTNKQRITIRLDPDIIKWFKQRVHNAGGGSYQNCINHALREYINAEGESIEKTLRRVIREELKPTCKKPA